MKKIVKKVTPRASVATKTQGSKAGQNKNYTTVEVVQKYGNIQFPGLSAVVMTMRTKKLKQVRGNIYEGLDAGIMGDAKAPEYHIQDFYVDFGTTADKGEFFRVHINNHFHNCVCHKLAALSFFAWSPKDGHYVHSPLIDGHVGTNQLIIGEVERINKIE